MAGLPDRVVRSPGDPGRRSFMHYGVLMFPTDYAIAPTSSLRA